MNQSALPTLAVALEWLEAHWHENRTAPVKVHEARTTDGELGGLRFSHAFSATLNARPSDVTTVTVKTPCSHPGLSSREIESGKFCHLCLIRDSDGNPLVNTGSWEKTIERYRYPMWKALVGLQNALRPRRTPHPYSLILDLAEHGWQPKVAAHIRGLPWDMAEALYLRAIRQLCGRYQLAPTARRSWIDKSESQRQAEAVSAA